MLSQLSIRKSLHLSHETPSLLHHFYMAKVISGYPILTAVNWPQHGCAISGCTQSHFIYLLTSFSEHRPAQRECGRTGLRSHARCHPYPIPQPVKVGHTTGVYDPYSFRIVMWVLLRPTRTNQWKCCETGPTVFRPYPRRLGWRPLGWLGNQIFLAMGLHLHVLCACGEFCYQTVSPEMIVVSVAYREVPPIQLWLGKFWCFG